MTYLVAAVALAIVLFLVLRRRDSRVATIKSLPTYGTTEAAGLQQAIATQGPTRLLSPTESTSTLVEIEPARSEVYFREQTNGRRATSCFSRRAVATATHKASETETTDRAKNSAGNRSASDDPGAGKPLPDLWPPPHELR